MYKCPKCGNEDGFDVFVDSPIWTIDCDGDIISTHVYSPDDYDSTVCQNCGYVADLRNFELEENDCTPKNVCVFRDGELRLEAYVEEVLLDANNLERIE